MLFSITLCYSFLYVFYMSEVLLYKYTHAPNLATSHHLYSYSHDPTPHYVLPPLIFYQSCCSHLLHCLPTFHLPYITQSNLLSPIKSDYAILLLKTLQWLPTGEVKIHTSYRGSQRSCSLSTHSPGPPTTLVLMFLAKHAVLTS